jgi:hypothetical protein
MNHLFPEKVLQANFVRVVNDWFDVANSRRKFDPNPLKCAYGVNFDEQEKVLSEMATLMSTCLQVGSKKLLPFQHGIIQWCHASKNLFQYVYSKYDVQWLMTTRVNDHVENFFSRERGLGATFDHPGPFETLNRIRLLMIGQSEAAATVSVDKSPVELANDEDEDGHFLTVAVTASIKQVAESIPDDIFEPFELPEENVDENNNASETDSASDCLEQGLQYFGGYLAHKFRADFPELGNPTGTLEPTELFKLSPWLAVLSRGGLICPTTEFVSKLKSFEQLFVKFHGKEDICKEQNVMKSLIWSICQSYPTFPRKVIVKYVRTRTFFQLKYVCRKMKESKIANAKLKRNAKKIKHFTT